MRSLGFSISRGTASELHRVGEQGGGRGCTLVSWSDAMAFPVAMIWLEDVDMLVKSWVLRFGSRVSVRSDEVAWLTRTYSSHVQLPLQDWSKPSRLKSIVFYCRKSKRCQVLSGEPFLDLKTFTVPRSAELRPAFGCITFCVLDVEGVRRLGPG